MDGWGPAADRAQGRDKFRRGLSLAAASGANEQMQLQTQAFYGINALQYK